MISSTKIQFLYLLMLVSSSCLSSDEHKLCRLALNSNFANEKGQTPFHIAAKEGDMDMLTFLQENGAQLEAKDNKDRTPLHIAVKNNKKDAVRFLLSKEANPDSEDECGYTPMFYAYFNGNKRIARILQKSGARLDHVADTMHNETVLNSAAADNNIEWVRWLIRKKADVNLSNGELNPPLSVAAANGSAGVVDLLLKAGADVKYKDCDGWTALHHAIHPWTTLRVDRQSDSDHSLPIDTVTQLLIKNGADVNAIIIDKQTPLDIFEEAYSYFTKTQAKAIKRVLRENDGITYLGLVQRRGAYKRLIQTGCLGIPLIPKAPKSVLDKPEAESPMKKARIEELD